MKASGDNTAGRTAGNEVSRTTTQEKTSNLTRDGVLRNELSAADKAVQSGVKTTSGAKALAETSAVKLEQHASMTPSEFWGSKLGECWSKGIAPADCTPWS